MNPLNSQRPKLASNLFSSSATKALQLAQGAACQWGHSYVGCEHLLFGLLQGSSPAITCLRSTGLSSAMVRTSVLAKVGQGAPNLFPTPGMTPRLKGVIRQGAVEMIRHHHNQLDSTHLILGLLQENEGLATSLIRAQIPSIHALSEAVIASLNGDNSAGQPGRSRTDREVYTPESKLLDLFTSDMVQAALRGKYDPVVGRDKEIVRTMQILIRRSKNNPVLLGDPGVGKTAVAEGLAIRMSAGQVPEALKGKRLLALDLSSMVAGTKYRGEFEDRVNNLLRDIRRAGNIILFLDEMHTIVGAGSAEGAIDAANILKPALSRGDIQMIGATTLEEYRKHIEKDAALERRFQPITIEEPTCETSLRILQRLRPRYEAHHHVTITPEALEAAVSLSHRYLPGRRLPDKAIDLIDEAASSLRLEPLTLPLELRALEDKVVQTFQDKENAIRKQEFERAAMLRNAELDFRRELEEQRRRWRSEQGSFSVTREAVASVLSMWTGIPASSLTQEERRNLLSLEDTLHRRVAGQDEAIRAVAEAIRRGRTGLTDPRRPTGTFLFLGPTGVGKTELCKALAEALFGTEDALLRFDMTEYAEAHAVSRLLGSPPGYVGFDEGGQLTERVRRRPYSVVLFDELEKAHPDIWSILLQIMEDGILTDAKGTRVDFRSTVLVMTSNAGAEQLSRKGIGFAGTGSPASKQSPPAESRTAALAELRKTFRPEFLNRIDELIVFRALDHEELQEIAKKMLLQLAERMHEMGISFTFTPDSLQILSTEAFDPVYGARPLRRLLQTKVETPAARMLLEGQLSPGGTLALTVQDNHLALQTPVPVS
ncbi:MAG: ATP-dependent Clp protease ATP-binding subunit ClpC [Firmicutes bacterium]|nr:ATP-dependent Clp protease ATP-binding subunit ClpC [Bacillota bacterium]